MRAFSKFNELFSHKHHHKLKTLCQPLFNSFGINSFFYQAVEKNGNFSSICTDPELMNYYFVEYESYRRNPFITQFSQLKTGIYFQEKVQDDQYQNTEKSLQDKFGIKYFCLFTRKCDDICYEFGFGRDPENSAIDLLIINNSGIINKFIAYFESEMASVISDMHNNSVNLQQELCLHRVSKGIIPSIDIDHSKKTLFLKKIEPELPYRIEHLTKREITCIKHILKGKTARQIGIELHLSTRTVGNRLI